METLKQESLKAISNLPDESTIDDIMYRLYVIDKVRKGEEAVLKGKVISLDDLKKEVKKW
ncbi:MAG: hypothetical protein ABI840_00900 [bacterium]